MVKVLFGLLVCVLVGGEDRYSDYSGARMPIYNMEDGIREAPLTDEYIDRSPDAPAPYDYKYEEDSHDKTNKLLDKVEDYKQHKKLRDPQNLIDSDEIEKREDEIVPKFKANRRSRKHRSRIKNRDPDGESSRRAARYSGNRKFDRNYVDLRNNYYSNKARPREDNNLDSDNYDDTDTTEKIIRRKPRDRTTNRSDNDEAEVNENEVKPNERDDDSEDIGKGRRRFQVRRPSLVPDLPKMKPHTNYPDYNDYYDMKRVKNIKNKLPGLLRKTQASSTQSSSTRHLQELTYRRVNPRETTVSTSKIPTTMEMLATGTSESMTNIRIPTNATELSLAERSRLSILKKARKKEEIRNVTWTTKPPVLMQVTYGMQTLVMVEAANSDNAGFRSREIFDDSPERIAKVKKLMRHKLVANARSIHELTDNWDEMVCDYVDTSLIDAGSCLRIKLVFEMLIPCVGSSIFFAAF